MPRGICFGVCGGGVAIAAVYPVEPFSMLGTEELIPTITMVVVMFLGIMFVGSVFIKKIGVSH